MSEVSELGQRIKALKEARGLSFERLAAASNVSVASLKRVTTGTQQGMHADSVMRLAAALDVEAGELMGVEPPPESEATAAAVRTLRDTVLSPSLLPGITLGPHPGEPRSLEAVAGEVGEAWAAYWAGSLDHVVGVLPALIAEGRTLAEHLGPAPAALPLSQSWELTATTLVMYGCEDLAGMAAERAVRAAAAGPDEALTATVTGTYSWVLLHQGRYAEAESVAVSAATRITPPRRGATPAALAAYGNLLMTALAPRVALGREPVDLVDEARGVGAQLGRKTPVYQTAFGPNTVAMQEVYGWAMLRSPGRALAAARSVQLDQLVGISRGRHWIDLAQAQVDAGKFAAALKTLRAASQMSAEWFGRQKTARELVRQIREEAARPSDELVQLAALAKVDTREPGVSLVL